MELRAFAVLIMMASSTAFADDAIPGHKTSTSVDLPVVTGALGLAAASFAIPIRAHEPWDTELFGDLDRAARANFSPRAASIADATLGLTIAAPIAYLTALNGSSYDDADGDRLVLYGETLAVNLALVQVTKYLVQRPRPYTYNSAARAYVRHSGDDAYLSFYSAHAAMAFGASVSGAYLLGASDKASASTMRLVWGGGLATATLTATMRVRAGKHYPSDVIVGALVGTAVGYTVPALHASPGSTYAISAGDVGMGLLGIAAGLAIGEMIPLGTPSEANPSLVGRAWSHVDAVSPLPLHGGAGLALTGSL